MGRRSNPRGEFGTDHIITEAEVLAFFFSECWEILLWEEFHQVNNFSQICNALNFMLKNEMILFKFEVCIFYFFREVLGSNSGHSKPWAFQINTLPLSHIVMP